MAAFDLFLACLRNSLEGAEGLVNSAVASGNDRGYACPVASWKRIGAFSTTVFVFVLEFKTCSRRLHVGGREKSCTVVPERLI